MVIKMVQNNNGLFEMSCIKIKNLDDKIFHIQSVVSHPYGFHTDFYDDKSYLAIYKGIIELDIMEFKKIRKQGTQKIITIPAKSNLVVGDYVCIQKINLEVAPSVVQIAGATVSVTKQDE